MLKFLFGSKYSLLYYIFLYAYVAGFEINSKSLFNANCSKVTSQILFIGCKTTCIFFFKIIPIS